MNPSFTAGLASDDDEYEYDEEVDLTKPAKGGGSRLVNARATAASQYQFVGAFFLSASSRLTSPTCTAALITPDVALRFYKNGKFHTKLYHFQQHPLFLL